MKLLHSIVTLCMLVLIGILFVPSVTSAQTCCVQRGNVNGIGGIDIADVTHLVAYSFKGGPPPPCAEEGNVNGIGDIDIADVTYLVAYSFKSGPVPPPCPASAHVVFSDEYGNDVTYQAFAGSLLDAVQVSTDSMYAGTQGLQIRIPGVDPWWSGGAFVDTSTVARVGGRDLSAFNALTFWAKSSVAATLDVVGLGNDNTGTSKYQAEMNGLALTTSWQQFVVPIPLAEKLTDEKGLFYFAEGEGVEYNIWIDEVVFDSLTTITNPRPAVATETLNVNLGDTLTLSNGTVIFDVGGTDMTVKAWPGYFTFQSSDPGVVDVAVDGTITAVGVGTATLTANLGLTAATGTVTVNVAGTEAVPATPAPTPTQAPGDVISLFSDAYTNQPVDTWSPVWDGADVEDYLIGSDSTKKYTNLVYAVINFESNTIDATGMTDFHMDVWTPDPTAAPAVFKVKLVDFGANGVYDGGGDDREHELTFDENTMATENWVSIDVPLSSFTNLTTRGHMAQMVISGDPNTVYLDNIYFYYSGPTEPTTPAPTPDLDSLLVISLFSDQYTDNPVDTWSPVWDGADVADFLIGSNNNKKYTNLAYAVIEFSSSTIDATGMDYFHMDVWTPDPTAAPAVFNVKLVDFGADGVYGNGDDVEHEIALDENTMNTGSWVSINLALADFTGLTTKGHLAQLVISGNPNTVFVDNVYFSAAVPAGPTASAPTPSLPSGDVISLFSDAYTNVTVDTWSAGWDAADVADIVLGPDNLKMYTNLSFAGIEFTSSTIDATTMTHFHMDVWTPDPTAAPAVFKIKLVDFGAGGVWGGGDDVEHEITLDEVTMNTGGWVSIELPLADFTGLTTKAHLAQLVISGNPNTVYVDNVYLHK